jgi:hypothetical protein
VWREPIGAGWSSFAVVGKYGVTQEQRGEEEDVGHTPAAGRLSKENRE